MIYSMTGFGRSGVDIEGEKNFNIEIKSINHRFLDINVRMPRMMISLEERIRKLVSKEISRGKVDIFITYNNYEKLGVSAKLNKNLSDSYVNVLNEIKQRYGIRDDISVSLVARFPDVVFVNEKEEDLEEIWTALENTLTQAITMLKEMRKNEGAKLQKDILKKCEIIKRELALIENKSPLHVVQYKQKLTERLKELMENTNIDETRLNMELSIYAEKSCIDEEITRLYSHIAQMLKTLNLNEPIGRKLDFLVQEMNREANTIASKSNDLDITNSALNIKNEIEKIREQIQNVE